MNSDVQNHHELFPLLLGPASAELPDVENLQRNENEGDIQCGGLACLDIVFQPLHGNVIGGSPE